MTHACHCEEKSARKTSPVVNRVKMSVIELVRTIWHVLMPHVASFRCFPRQLSAPPHASRQSCIAGNFRTRICARIPCSHVLHTCRVVRDFPSSSANERRAESMSASDSQAHGFRITILTTTTALRRSSGLPWDLRGRYCCQFGNCSGGSVVIGNCSRSLSSFPVAQGKPAIRWNLPAGM